jgi:hypothetical protein
MLRNIDFIRKQGFLNLFDEGAENLVVALVAARFDRYDLDFCAGMSRLNQLLNRVGLTEGKSTAARAQANRRGRADAIFLRIRGGTA